MIILIAVQGFATAHGLQITGVASKNLKEVISSDIPTDIVMGHSGVDIGTTGSIDNIAWQRILLVIGNIIKHHDYDILDRNTVLEKDLNTMADVGLVPIIHPTRATCHEDTPVLSTDQVQGQDDQKGFHLISRFGTEIFIFITGRLQGKLKLFYYKMSYVINVRKYYHGNNRPIVKSYTAGDLTEAVDAAIEIIKRSKVYSSSKIKEIRKKLERDREYEYPDEGRSDVVISISSPEIAITRVPPSGKAPEGTERSILAEIWKYIPVSELSAWCRASKKYAEFCRKPEVWQFYLKRDFGIDYSKDDALTRYKQLSEIYDVGGYLTEYLTMAYFDFIRYFPCIIDYLTDKYSYFVANINPSYIFMVPKGRFYIQMTINMNNHTRIVGQIVNTNRLVNISVVPCERYSCAYDKAVWKTFDISAPHPDQEMKDFIDKVEKMYFPDYDEFYRKASAF